MKAQTKNHYQQGFSVIEVLITLFMIGATLMLFQATANAIVLNKYGRFREIALRVADKKIQSLRTTAFTQLPESGSFTDSQLASIPDGQASLTITEISPTLKDVSVDVTWTNPQNDGTQQVHLQTFVGSGGLGQ
jgi:Tfp pilus assembly protein PilV